MLEEGLRSKYAAVVVMVLESTLPHTRTERDLGIRGKHLASWSSKAEMYRKVYLHPR